jgi:CubicO group peptidase (beta-lactamase class C family)
VNTRPHLAAALAAVLTVACTAPRPEPAPARHPAALLADDALSRYAMYGLSGSVLLAIDGVTVLEKGYGLADRERSIAATAATLYDVGSIAKTFTAAAVLRLVEENRLELTDSLATLFPDVPPEKRGGTIHQLLTHTAGFALDPAHAGIAAADSPDTFVAKAMSSASHSAPGRYAYSNLGYGLLAILVDRLAGGFRAVVNETLIARARLTQTTWWRDSLALAIPGAAVGYVFSDRENVLSPEPAFSRGGPRSPVWSKWPLGAAGIVSTVGDLDRWLDALHGGRVLSPALTRAMFTRQDSTGSQGYGWTVTSRGTVGTAIYRGGSRTGFNSMLALYPEQRARLVFALNQSVESQWHSLVWRTLERAITGQRDSLPPATVHLTAAGRARFAGAYAVPGGGLIRVIADGDELIVGVEGQNAVDVVQGAAVPNAARHEELSLRVLSGIAAGGPVDSTLLAASRYQELVSWLSARASLSPSLRIEHLGTTPHPSGGGRAQAFVRLGTDDRLIVRLIWEGERLLAWSDGVRLPLFRRFRTTSATSAVAFHAREPQWVTLRLSADASVVTLESPDGRVTPAATRTRSR